MANILLLYDTKEKDLARDYKELLEEINIGSIILIPLSPNKGLTLEKKEEKYFESADGAVFLITPGSERLGSFFPSPSVTHEMGQAKQKFNKKPECVVYLVDETCTLPAIDQKTYIPFNRKDIRSIIASLTQLIKDLKQAGLFRTTPIPTRMSEAPKKMDLLAFSKSLKPQIKQILFNISNKPDGAITDDNLVKLLSTDYKLSTQKINFIKRDLGSSKTVTRTVIDNKPFSYVAWFLNSLGWEIVRMEIEEKKKGESGLLSTLLGEYLIKK